MNSINNEEEKFIQRKTREIFRTINETDFNDEDVDIVKEPLSGISNTIFRVTVIPMKDHLNLKVKEIFFKLFGRISELVDRNLETYVMESLYKYGIGAKIYETDYKSYRAEEFLLGYTPLPNQEMLKESTYSKIFSVFTVMTTFGDLDFYKGVIGNRHKEEFFKELMNDPRPNIFNFIMRITRSAKKYFDLFKERFENEEHTEEERKRLGIIEYHLDHMEKLVYECSPSYGIFTLNHNDAHPLNIMFKGDEVILCDFEYGSYNYLGFDAVNYLIESAYRLEDEKFPFFQVFHDLELLTTDRYYEYYLKFFEILGKRDGDFFQGFEDLVEKSKSKDYYLRLIGLSCLLWFSFAIIYLNYDNYKLKVGFDYFNFSLSRLSVYQIANIKMNKN